MHILKNKTTSICPVCYRQITAQVIEINNEIFIEKRCKKHGQFCILIEKDADFYKKIMNKTYPIKRRPFFNLVIPVIHDCNLNCNICYLPQRGGRELTFEELKKIILDFEGREIVLAGGEPTLRNDLPELIEFIVKNNKNAILVTNGIKLADSNYVKRLKKTGITVVSLSFNAFDDNSYKKINGRHLFKLKLKALKNLKKEKITTIISTTLVKGINENDVIKIYRYCLRNLSFIMQLRIRSSVPVGKHIGTNTIYLSELVKMVSNIIGIKKDAIVRHSINLENNMPHLGRHAPKSCHIEIDLFALLMKEFGINTTSTLTSKKFLAFFKLLSTLGLFNTLKIIISKIKGEKQSPAFRIGITKFPDKHTIDLNEMRLCHTGHLSRDGKTIFPFCVGISLNEKNPIL